MPGRKAITVWQNTRAATLLGSATRSTNAVGYGGRVPANTGGPQPREARCPLKSEEPTKSVAPLAFAAYETGAIVSRFGGDFLVRRRGAAFVVRLGAVTGVAGLVGVVAAPAPPLAIACFFVVGLGLAILAPLSFAAIAGAVGPAAVDVAIARLNIANYLGAILGGALIGAAASSHHLRWAFVIPLAIVPAVLLVANAFRAADVVEPTAQ